MNRTRRQASNVLDFKKPDIEPTRQEQLVVNMKKMLECQAKLAACYEGNRKLIHRLADELMKPYGK